MFGRKTFTGLAAATLVAVLSMAGQAAAATIGFERITNNSSADAAGQLSADVTDDGASALMTFSVSAGANPGANIKEIYFSDLGAIFAPPPVYVSHAGNVAFDLGSATPGELPGANDASPPFVTTVMLLAEANGNNATGITVNETLTMRLIYAGTYGFSDVTTALDNGQLRVGLHVSSLLAGESDSFVSGGEVPLPAAAWLFGSGLIALGVTRRRKTS